MFLPTFDPSWQRKKRKGQHLPSPRLYLNPRPNFCWALERFLFSTTPLGPTPRPCEFPPWRRKHPRLRFVACRWVSFWLLLLLRLDWGPRRSQQHRGPHRLWWRCLHNNIPWQSCHPHHLVPPNKASRCFRSNKKKRTFNPATNPKWTWKKESGSFNEPNEQRHSQPSRKPMRETERWSCWLKSKRKLKHKLHGRTPKLNGSKRRSL